MAKFNYNDKVAGFIDGFGIRKGHVIDIDPSSEWPYMIRCTDDTYASFAEDELAAWDGKEEA